MAKLAGILSKGMENYDDNDDLLSVVIILPKMQTLEIQSYLHKLGKELGFISEMESQIDKQESRMYAPIIDVVWYLDLKQSFHIDKLSRFFKEDTSWLHSIEKLPIAGFEIEGSTTSSKNQLSNFTNLLATRCLFKFIIVNNEAAGKENDTYRRGLKIYDYFSRVSGASNIFFFDWQHIKNSSRGNGILPEDRFISVKRMDNHSFLRSTFGGETTSVPIYESIIPDFLSTGFEIRQNFSPEESHWQYLRLKQIADTVETSNELTNFFLRRKGYIKPSKSEIRSYNKVSDCYYIPKLDLIAGFNPPKAFFNWLKIIGHELEYDVVHYPLLLALLNSNIDKVFLPLISVEIETTAGKHMNGGIVNMSRNSYCGILIAPSEAKSHLNYFRRSLGLNNVLFFDYKGGTT